MRHSTTPFDYDADLDAERADDLTREFWGDSASWVTDHRARAFQIRGADESSGALRLDHTPSSLRAVRDGIAAFRPKRRWRDDSTGPIERTREHGVLAADVGRTAMSRPVTSTPPRRRPSPEQLPHRHASIAELAAGDYDEYDWPATVLDDDLEPTGLIELTPDSIADRMGLRGVDPIVVRIGIVLLVVLLAIPLALAMRDDEGSVGTTDIAPAGAALGVSTNLGPTDRQPGDAGTGTLESVGTDAGDTDTIDAGASATATSPDGATTGSEAADAPAAAVQETTMEPVGADEAATTDGSTRSAPLTESQDIAVVDEAATVDATAERSVPDCSLVYTAGAGDSWYGIADAAGVSPSALLEQNRATLDSVIFPGDEICLPTGATVPTPPTTTAPSETTDAPTTTSAPATTVAPASAAEVQALIREIFPDDLEDRALEIARRESNFVATADNGWCCVGVFQIYWSVHRGWLDEFGIETRDDLKDARKNITAAYALYQRSGGWHPWSTA